MQLNAEQERIAEHVTQQIGPIHGIIELPAPVTRVAVLHVPATQYKPFQVLCTAGMSATPMPVPEDEPERPQRIELMLGLPADWSVASSEQQHTWPARLLASLALFPQKYAAWLGVGHTVPHGEPMQPYDSSTQLCCALIAPPLSLPPEAQTITTIAKHQAHMLAVVPLFEHEVNLKLEQNVNTLFERLDNQQVNEVIDPHRRSVAGALIDLLDRNNPNA
ncbi:MAG: suppressor of fused domain protein [Myxococcales bacterium]|nr:suppressor of fused domain protein [Myxococcales bacterium]